MTELLIKRRVKPFNSVTGENKINTAIYLMVEGKPSKSFESVKFIEDAELTEIVDTWIDNENHDTITYDT